ncbi:hypothetical protein [Seonamhaeicola sp.]|uniref:hypothetical protein n=1 Tax=Seonamhaeicola sp. TaxID=1912245 RepID=UPI0026128437|nr:hypothetical protein [Seonamhaeicola sp.]
MSWLKNKKRYLIIFLCTGLLTLTVLVVIKHIYKPHKTVAERTVKYSGTPQELLDEVHKDVTPWLNAVVRLSGTVTAMDASGFTLDNMVYCQTDSKSPPSGLQINAPATIKGRVIGYDDLLEELKLDQTIHEN